jgi:hypothetical protein
MKFKFDLDDKVFFVNDNLPYWKRGDSAIVDARGHTNGKIYYNITDVEGKNPAYGVDEHQLTSIDININFLYDKRQQVWVTATSTERDSGGYPLYSKGDTGRVSEQIVRNGLPYYKIDLIGEGVFGFTTVPQSDLSDVYENFEADLDAIKPKPVVNVSQQVEDYLSEKEKNKKFKDTDGRIGGSAKERSALRMITIADLESLEKDEITAKEMVKKDKVFPKFTAQEEMDKGVSSGTAFLKSKLRETYGAKAGDSPELRKLYVGYVEYLLNKFGDVVSIEEFNKKRAELTKEVISVFISILSPELAEQIEDERANIKEKNTYFKNEVSRYEKLINELVIELFAKYDKKEVNYGYWMWENQFPADEPLMVQIKNYEIEKRNATNSIHTKDLLPIEERFAERFGRTSRLYYLKDRLIEEAFGSRFINFIEKGTQPMRDLYAKAIQYDGFTEEQASEARRIEGEQRYIETIREYSEEVSFLQSDPFKEEIVKFFEEKGRGGMGFGGGVFGAYRTRGKKYFYWNDVKNTPTLIPLYIKRYIEHKETAISNSQKKLDEIREKYKAGEPDWSWSDARKKGSSDTERTDITANSGVPLSYIKRIGGVAITDEMINTDEKVKDFFPNVLGVTRIEYGLTIPDNEKQQHIKHFSGALLDLAEILNMDIKWLNGWGNLGIKFASSGRGKAAAHYESNRKAINLTRSKGDGTVAHEYAHYLDNMLGGGNADKFGSVTGSQKGRWYYEIKNITNSQVFQKMKDIFSFINDRKYISEEGALNKLEVKKKIKKVIKADNKRTFSMPYGLSLEIGIEEFAKRFMEKYSTYRYYDKMKPKDFEILAYIPFLFKKSEFEFEFDVTSSLYYSNSLAMSSDYWSREWELFARAFETYIYDKLEKSGRFNNYLVSGGYFDHYAGVYPEGEEREILFELYDRLFKQIKISYEVPDFVAFNDQRADEYIDLNEDKSNEEADAGVVIDSETGEVIEVLRSPIDTKKAKKRVKKKLKKLLAILEEAEVNKFEFGGEVQQSELTIIKLKTFINNYKK